jgi:hypothetical protein
MVNEGRWTVELEGDFVVFIIGARLGNPLKSWRAVPLLREMRTMLGELSRDPDAGLLGFQSHGLTIVQYWRSFDALATYAGNPDRTHAGVWREWYRRAQHLNPAAGIWHETYRVRAGEFEAIYQNMKPIGLAKAGTPVPVGRRTEDARSRMAAVVPAARSGRSAERSGS